MPLTPYMGLSVMVHLFVIAWHKITSWLSSLFPKKKFVSNVPKKPKPIRSHMFVNLSIIGLIFVFVLANAALLVSASIADRYSSFQIVGEYVADLTSSEGKGNTVAATAESVPKAQTEDSSPAPAQDQSPALPSVEPLAYSPNNCLGPFNAIASDYKYSVVDYLEAEGENYSFAARQAAAANFGIENYQGTDEQNQALFVKLLVQSGKLPEFSSPSCKN